MTVAVAGATGATGALGGGALPVSWPPVVWGSA